MARHLILLFISTVLLHVSSAAQLPQWLIEPVHDTIFVKKDRCLLQTERDEIPSLWTFDGNLLGTVHNRIMPFHDGMATVIDRQKQCIVGIIDTLGNSKEMPQLGIAYDSPFYENGYLLVNNGGVYSYYGKDGNKADAFQYFVRAYPFHHGYATYFTYANYDKMKDPCYGYLKSDGSAMQYRMSVKGKIRTFDEKNIKFLSAVGTDDKGVAVIKDRLYWYNSRNDLFEPMCRGNADNINKRHLELVGNYSEYFKNLPYDTVKIKARYGNGRYVRLIFDRTLRFVRLQTEDSILTFPEPQQDSVRYASPISPFGTGKIGLAYNGRKILPEQFDAVGQTYDNTAFVKLNGKWGLLRIIPEAAYSLKLDKDKDEENKTAIGFRHHEFETKIRLELPRQISARDARLEIPKGAGIYLEKNSRLFHDAENSNFVTYDCALTIPEDIADVDKDVTYSPITVTYDGLKLYETSLDIKAWHVKYYDVEHLESETNVKDGVATISLVIKTNRLAGEKDYPFELKIEPEWAVSTKPRKITETRYTFDMYLQEGENHIDIVLTEKGCPPQVFPYDINYTKPSARKRQKEHISVQKRDYPDLPLL